MKIAVEGCAHGALDKIYETLLTLEERYKFKVDLLIICGDFQSVRNVTDMESMAVPKKYRDMQDFHRYYSGEKTAPVLTIFIGGNHEASNYLAELPYGGWVCENIYYMGYASVINVGGVRIAGLSGIYKGADYLKGHFEIPPYDESTKRSAYHVRQLEIFRLKQITKPLDIVITHDWPRGIYNFGDKEKLLRKKKFFREEVESNKLGCRPTEELLQKLKPKYWFAAHLHCKFAALVPHEENDEVVSCTKFLALDKCLPYRDFLQVLDIGEPVQKKVEICFDPEWLCILKSTDHLLSFQRSNYYLPGPGCKERWDFTATEEEYAKINTTFTDLKVPQNFVQTAPAFSIERQNSPAREKPYYMNPQTTTFCEKLGIRDPLKELAFPSAPSVSIGEFTYVEDNEFNVTNVSVSSINPDVSSDSDLGSEDSPDDLSQTSEGTGLDTSEVKSSQSQDNSLDEEEEVYFLEDKNGKQRGFFIDRGSDKVASRSPLLSEVNLDCRKKLHMDMYGSQPVEVLSPEEFLSSSQAKNVLGLASSNKDSPESDKLSELKTENADSPPKKPKVLKRRNQAIYKEDSDEDQNI